MNKKGVFYICLSFSFMLSKVYAQETIEQSAFNYFFSEIFINEYSNEVNSLGFSSLAEGGTNDGFYYSPCFTKEIIDYPESDTNESPKKIITSNINSVKFKNRKLRYNLKIFRALVWHKEYIVQIHIQRRDRVDIYFVRLNLDGHIFDWCKTGIIF